MSNKKLRVGVLLDDLQVPAWEHKMFRNIIDSDYAEICLVVLNGNEKPVVENKSIASKINNNRGRLFYLAIRKTLEVVYSTLIERNTYLPDANKSENSEHLFTEAQHIKVRTIQSKWSDVFYEDDLQEINSHQLDILVRCGFRILRGGILNAAKYGVWSYHHGDNYKNRGGPAGYWESMEGWPETGSILQILTEDLDNGRVLYRSYSSTDVMSVTDNTSNYYWKSLSFITRKMEELHRIGGTSFLQKVDEYNRHPAFYRERLYVNPTNSEMARLVATKVIKKIKLQLEQKFMMEQWILLFHMKSELSSSLWRYQKIIPPKDRFWADPHIIHHNDMYYIYIEEYLYETAIGRISVITMDSEGNYSEPEVVLEKPYHLSYPYVFEHEGEYYMIPESYENKTIQLYKCTEFPLKWEFQLNLKENIQAVDATLHRHDNKWWMFANVVEHEGASTWDELFLYSSDNLLSTEWAPHPQNPIVSDCKSARPAGSLFMQDGALYRPSQNCSQRYGYGFNISEVKTLTETSYEEDIVSKVEPNWDKSLTGTHTFNRVKSLHVIDALYKRRA